MTLGVNIMICGELFGNETGIKLIKYFDSHYLVAIFMIVVANFVLTSDGSFTKVFIFTLILDAIALFLSFVLRKTSKQIV